MKINAPKICLPDTANVALVEQIYREFEQRKLMKKRTIKELLKV